ncbi:Metallo-dependent Hydrolase [Abortiporus biennis]
MSKPPKPRRPSAFFGDFVHCTSLGEVEILHDHLVVVNIDGFIESVEPSSSEKCQRYLKGEGDIECMIPQGCFTIPTFCDLHLHAPQFLYQGTGLHLSLMEWLNEYAFKAEERIDGDEILSKKVYKRLARRLIENGTGAVVLFGTIREETNLILAEAMLEAGLRAYVGKLSMDKSSRETYIESSAKQALSSASSFADRCEELVRKKPQHKRLVKPILTPRFVPTCSDELLKGLGRLSDSRGLWIQSHMAEAHDQVKWVREERGVEDIEVFERSGLLTPRTIQAHCTFLDPPSLSHVAELGTSIAHCPLSNAYFSAEPFRLRESLDQKVKVGLGTDIAGGYNLDIMSSMRQAVAISRMREGSRVMANEKGKEKGKDSGNQVLSIDWKEALYLATTGGARAMGLPTGTGTIEVGAPFDVQMIQLIDEVSGEGVGQMDFFDIPYYQAGKLTLKEVEKWWKALIHSDD